MKKIKDLTRQEAVSKLESFEISGPAVYLVDIIPLVEMIWADGQAQLSELAVLEHFLKQHVKRINKLLGKNFLTKEHTRIFTKRFLEKKPAPELLGMLRELMKKVRVSKDFPKPTDALMDSLLSACMDIAAASSSTGIKGIHERFQLSEKLSFFQIWESIRE